MRNFDHLIKYFKMNAQTIKSNLPNIFLNGLCLSEKSFLLINPVLDSAMGRDFHLLRNIGNIF